MSSYMKIDNVRQWGRKMKILGEVGGIVLEKIFNYKAALLVVKP